MRGEARAERFGLSVWPGARWRRCLAAALVALPALAAGAAELPWIVRVESPVPLRAGHPGELRLTYRAPGANVAAVREATEDLDVPLAARALREREVSVVARAYGYQRGELVWPLAFATPGWKRVTLTLVTDEGELSDPAVIELDVQP